MSRNGNDGALTHQFQVNVKDLNKAASAIRGHDRALQNVLEEINTFSEHVGEIVRVQNRLADGIRSVTDVQRRVAQAEQSLSGSLADVSTLADDKVPAATVKLQGAVSDSVDALNQASTQLEGFLRQAREAGSTVSEDALKSLGTEIQAALDGTTSALQDRLNASAETLRQHLHEQVEAIETAATGQLNDIAAAATRIDNVLGQLESTQSTFVARFQELEQKMTRFEEQIGQATAAMESRISEREAQLEEEKATLGKAISRVKSLFG